MPETLPEATGQKFQVVGHNERRVDGTALVTGKPVFVDDPPAPPGTLHLALLTSPHAHARIRSIDTAAAEAMPGVALVLTHANTPTTRYTTAGQGYPEPSPYDARMFDDKVRFVGDRVAAVAADTLALAREAVRRLEVDYELLDPVLSIDAALAEGAPWSTTRGATTPGTPSTTSRPTARRSPATWTRRSPPPRSPSTSPSRPTSGSTSRSRRTSPAASSTPTAGS
jgi:CO/xanthine dehydrogenase Mo-binding subunit